MRSEARSTIGVVDLARRLPALIPELPTMAKGVLGLIRTPDAKESIGLVFQRAAAAHPRRTFLRFEGDSLSYRNANIRVNRYAHVLTDLGVSRGDVVGILGKNAPETLLIALAAVKLGALRGCSTTISAETCSRTASRCSTAASSWCPRRAARRWTRSTNRPPWPRWCTSATSTGSREGRRRQPRGV